MKIHQQGTGIAADRTERAAQTGRVGAETGANGSRSRQIGLDSVEVSHLGETASRLVESSMQSRQDRVAVLASQFQSGNYAVNLANLSHSILDHDLESDASYAS